MFKCLYFVSVHVHWIGKLSPVRIITIWDADYVWLHAVGGASVGTSQKSVWREPLSGPGNAIKSIYESHFSSLSLFSQWHGHKTHIQGVKYRMKIKA